jgi:hypothetical protein
MSMDAAQLSQAVNESRRRAEELVRGLTLEQVTQRPDPAKWSIAECIAHLNKTGKLVQKIARKGLESALANSNGRASTAAGTFSLGWRGRMLVWVAEPPPKFPIPAPKSVVPPVTIDEPAQLLPEFMRIQDEWEKLMKDAAGLDISRITLGALFSPFRCQMSGGLMWMMAHQRRHLCQAENVKKALMARSIAA